MSSHKPNRQVLFLDKTNSGVVRKVARDLDGNQWITFEVDAFAEQEPFTCANCGEEGLIAGWQCLDDGAVEIGAECVTLHEQPNTRALVRWQHITSTASQIEVKERFKWEEGEKIDTTPAESWRVRLARTDSNGTPRSMVVQFHKGSKAMGCLDPGKAPDTADALDCVLTDAEVAAYPSFEDWASNLGFDPDSIRARNLYRRCQRQTARLRTFLGEQFQPFLEAERL